jgi:hypothetical protein
MDVMPDELELVPVTWRGAYEALLPDGRRIAPGDRFLLPYAEARARADVALVVPEPEPDVAATTMTSDSDTATLIADLDEEE